jgi:formylmethanofuran:tetrahydromethanopterin formyltransferase
MKILRNVAVVAAMGLTTSITAAPAMASADQYLIARCADGKYGIEIRARYLTSGTAHVFNQLSWRISGNVGSNNTVRFYFMQDAQPDIIFKTFNYKAGRTGSRNIWVTRPKAHQVFVRFRVRFDTSASSDPNCTYQTRGI